MGSAPGAIASEWAALIGRARALNWGERSEPFIWRSTRALSVYIVRPAFLAPGTHALRANVKPAHLPFGSKVIHTLRRQRTGF